MNPIKAGIVLVVLAGVGKACSDASNEAGASLASSMRPRGDLCSPTYAADRYTAEHEQGVDARCEDRQ